MSESRGRQVDLRVSGSPTELRAVRARIRQVGTEVGLSARQRDDLAAAVAEAVMNAVEHGNLGDPALSVDVRTSLDADALIVRVRDRGRGYDPAAHAGPDIHAKLRGDQDARGWGVHLMHRLADEVRTEVDEDGHVVELVAWLQGRRGTGQRAGGRRLEVRGRPRLCVRLRSDGHR